MNITDLPGTMANRTIQVGHCWHWEGAKNKKGYGSVSFGGKTHLAHRHAYTHLVGPIPDGLTIDHLCERKSCVKPTHLQPVPIAVNIQRRFNRVAICTCHVCITQRTAKHPKRPNVGWLQILHRMQMNLAAYQAAN